MGRSEPEGETTERPRARSGESADYHFFPLFDVMPAPADDELDENDFDENFDEDFFSELDEGLESELGFTDDDVAVEGEANGDELDEDAVVPFEEEDDF